MANTLGDLSLRDMGWLGKETDPIAPLMAGQSFVLRKQQAQQSADMHPLKMEALSQQTSLASQRERHATEMNPLLQARQGIDNQNAKTQGGLMRDQHKYNKATHDSRVKSQEQIARLRESIANVNSRNEDSDVALKEALAAMKTMDVELREATTNEEYAERLAKLQSLISQHEVQQDTQEARTTLIQETAKQASTNSSFLKQTLNSRVVSQLLGNELTQSSINSNNYNLSRRVIDSQRADLSYKGHQGDLDKMAKLRRKGKYEKIRELSPKSGSTAEQRQEFRAEQVKIMSDHLGREWQYENDMGRLNDIQATIANNKEIMALPKRSHQKLFLDKEDANGNPNPFVNQTTGHQTALGEQEFENFKEAERLRPLIGEDAWQQFSSTASVSAAPVYGGLAMTAGTGGMTTGNLYLGGNVFVPNTATLGKMKKLAGEALAVSRRGTETEKKFTDKFGNVTTLLPKDAVDANAKGEFMDAYNTAVAAAIKEAALDPTDEDYATQLATVNKTTAEGILQGTQFEGAVVISNQKQISALTKPTMIFRTDTGEIKFFTPGTTGGTGAVAPGAAAPGAIDPYTGQPVSAPYVDQGVFDSRKIIHEELTGAGIDSKLAQKIVYRGAQSDFLQGFLWASPDYDADEPVSKLVRMVHKDAQGDTEDALDDLLKGIHAGKGSKRPWIKTKLSQATLDRQIRLLGDNLDKPVAQWPIIGGRAWVPSEVTAARKYLPIYREAERYELELLDAVKKMPEK